MNERIDTCKTCVHFVDTLQGNKPNELSHCRRFPPVTTTFHGSMFPTVVASWWCGEHSEEWPRTRHP